MYLENIVVDALDPRRLGRFWEAVLGCATVLDEPDDFETRLVVPGGPVLDLCFEKVTHPPTPGPRLHLEVSGGERQDEVVERVLALGASHLDIGQRDVPWVVLADPEGNPFCVMEARPEYAVSGPLSSLPLDSTDVERDTRFWSELSGWVPAASSMPRALRHPTGRGPLLELCPEPVPKG
ncbi:MAG: VOC family protein, partial [Phycicoccus sp.]